MKKFMTLILVLALAMSLCAPAFAETYQAGDNPKTDVTFTYTVDEPKYVVEIPAKVELVLSGNWHYYPVTVSGGATETLNGRKIVITLEDAIVGNIKSCFPAGEPSEDHAYDDFLVVKNDSVPAGYYNTLMYGVAGDVDQLNRYNAVGSATTYLERGWKFFEFTEDGTKDLGFNLVGPPSGFTDSEGNSVWLSLDRIYPNSEYFGQITFGIKIA